ncbi:Uncharacterised protein [Vibrio cholerae]|nr:Uncharacterised protein [Vibrio cholerae]
MLRPKFGVQPLLGKQFFMCTAFGDLSFIQDKDVVSMADGIEAMGNTDHSATTTYFIHIAHD